MPASSSPDFVHRVARRIAQRRTALGLSQEGLAALLDIAVKNVQRVESGKQNLSLRTLERIATALETSPERLASEAVGGHPGAAHVTDEEEARHRREGARRPGALERLRLAGHAVRPATARGRRPSGAVPVTTLHAAAGKLEGSARAVEVAGWVMLTDRARASPGDRFVAEVIGASMAPSVPSGALCLFRPAGPEPMDGRTFLVAHEAFADDALGGPYALKRLRLRRDRRGSRLLVLESTNPHFPPLVVNLERDEVRVIAELERVLLA